MFSVRDERDEQEKRKYKTVVKQIFNSSNKQVGVRWNESRSNKWCTAGLSVGACNVPGVYK